MKSRNREINIFNMSLLDILCGALGAFCFMMIVLLPYYKPGKPEDAKRQQEMEKSVKELEDLKKQIKDPKLAQEMEDLIKKLREQIKELEGRVNSLTQENKQLADQNQTLQQKNKELTDKNQQLENQVQQLNEKNKQLQDRNNQLSMRMPGVLAAYCHGPMPDGRIGALDVIMWTPNPNVGGKSQPPFDPTRALNKSFFDGDVEMPLDSPVPMTLFLYRDVPVGPRQKVYIKLNPVEIHGNDPIKVLPLTAPMKVSAILTSATPTTLINLPDVELTPEHPWMMVGFLDADKTGKMGFTPATPAEREEEWRKLGKPLTAKP